MGGEEGEWPWVGWRRGSGHTVVLSLLKVRLPDGKTLRYSLQSSTTLSEVAKAVMADAPSLAAAVVQLVQVTGVGVACVGVARVGVGVWYLMDDKISPLSHTRNTHNTHVFNN